MNLDQVVPLLPIPADAPHALRASAMADPAAVRQPGSQGRVEETTEVHVSIGRIEVTAVQEAPMPKRPAQERPGPITLEHYLAGRRGGGR
ncbi:hypothetical protein KQ313_01435 [Synechococcus sp. CS-1325]|uniref:hypothetical protein n=1 Tax=Synechococcus sp. CS-1325 TaxID=2847979 RepID=UPI000DB4FCE4|nr:hypothetical protein [Synechococcus sp. CS-1325]MCT0198351.1 hypothetical protein [Synechococcus sp. CS-1325]PZV00208.1 MAG: hypothetical protein DCF24_07720 [Cyanobium sp.]